MGYVGGWKSKQKNAVTFFTVGSKLRVKLGDDFCREFSTISNLRVPDYARPGSNRFPSLLDLVECLIIAESLENATDDLAKRTVSKIHIATIVGVLPGETPTALPEAVGNLVEYCRRNKLPLVRGCDANAHHTEWCSTDSNTRGESLLECIISNKLSIENVGCEPTIVTSVKNEVLDITLVNELRKISVELWSNTSLRA